MKPKELVRAAMDLKRTDRTPLMCQMSIGHMLQQLGVSPVEFWFDAQTFADGLVGLRELYGFDGILVSLHGHFRNWREKVLERKQVGSKEEITLSDGSIMSFSNDELPQAMKTTTGRRLPDGTDLDSIDSGALREFLPDRVDYIPVSQGLRFKIDQENKFSAIESVIVAAGKDYSIHGEVTSAFDYFLDFVGHQEGLFALIGSPEKSTRILEHFTRLLEVLADEMCETGVDAIKISSPFAGAGFISPAFYRDFVAPYDGRLARSIRAKGVHSYIHTCGAIGDRLQIMLDLGASGIECLDPPPLGNVELAEAMRIARGKGFIKGNIDSVNILLNGTDEEILEDARRRIEIGRSSGSFILSTACSIAPMVKREKVQLLRKAVEEWGGS